MDRGSTTDRTFCDSRLLRGGKRIGVMGFEYYPIWARKEHENPEKGKAKRRKKEKKRTEGGPLGLETS